MVSQLAIPRKRDGFVFDPSLVLYLPLYELDGASFMSKDKHGHLCTKTGVPFWTPQGWELDGVGDKITVPNSTVFPSSAGAFTYEVWFQAQLQPGAVFGVIIGRGADTLRLQQAGTSAIGGIPANNLSFYTYSGGSHIDVGITVVAGTYYHFCLTYGCVIFRSYVNNIATATSTATPNQSGNLVIGASGSTAYYKGKISEVRVYNRRLNPNEIMQNY